MFDNLIARAIVPIAIAVTGFVVFGCILLYSLIQSDMTDEAVHHLDSFAETIVKSTRYAMMKDDRESLRNIVENVGTLSEVEQIRLFDHKGQIRFSGNPLETQEDADYRQLDAWMEQVMASEQTDPTRTQHNIDKAQGVIAVSMPILNEPKCSTAACHFHGEDEQVLGFLNLGISREPLEKTLALLRSRMIIFSIMVLFLTISGVAALLRRNLFLPILRLTFTAAQAVQGVPAKELPKADNKLGTLEKDVRLLVEQRDQAWREQKTARFLLKNAEHESRRDATDRDNSEHRAAPPSGPGKNPPA